MKEGYHIRKYKRYIDDHSVSVPKSTSPEIKDISSPLTIISGISYYTPEQPEQ